MRWMLRWRESCWDRIGIGSHAKTPLQLEVALGHHHERVNSMNIINLSFNHISFLVLFHLNYTQL